MRGEQRLAEGLANPRAKMLSWSLLTTSGPFSLVALRTWNIRVRVVSVMDTSISFISFSMSTASATDERERRKMKTFERDNRFTNNL